MLELLGGAYVLYDDAMAEIGMLRAENARLKAQCDLWNKKYTDLMQSVEYAAITNSELNELRAENARLTASLQWEENRANSIGTHGADCWKWGPSHYECARREIDRLTARLEPDYSVDDSLTARRIFSLMGYAERSPSLDPGADPLRDKVAAVIGTRVETARAAPLAPPKVTQAEEVTGPGWYWWRLEPGHPWQIKNIRRRYIPSTNQWVMILCGQFIGPINTPEVE